MSTSPERAWECSEDGDAPVERAVPRVAIGMRGDRISGLPKGQAERRKTVNRRGAVARIVCEVKDARTRRGIGHCYPELIHEAPPHDEAGDADTESFRNGVMIQALRQLDDENAESHMDGVE